MLSIVFGDAFEDATAADDSRIRTYRADGRCFVGFDTDDITHVCDTACVQTVLAEIGVPWVQTEDGGAYVHTSDERTDGNGMPIFATADVMGFDPGDDPYILCGACNTELLRDDDKYLEMFGTPIFIGEENDK